MMNNQIGGFGWGLGLPAWGLPLMAVLILWSLFWKGLGLWHSARRGEPWWFLAMLILNTAGILEIIYLFAFAKMKAADLLKKA